MKKLFFATAILFSFATASHAQDGERIFKKFKGEVSLGYGYFPGSNIKSGLLWSLEPRYALLDNLTIGGKFESAFQYKEYKVFDGYSSYSNDRLKIYESFSVTADYYFTNNFSARPFIGVGGGIHLVNITNSDMDYNTDQSSSTKLAFGGLARAGIEIKHFRLGIEYNLVANSKTAYSTYDPNTSSYGTAYDVSKNSYIGIKAGACFGGGPKKRERKHRH